MKKLLGVLAATALLALAALGAGCGANVYYPLSSHTVSLGPDTEQDVVWLQDGDGDVYRCTASQCAPPTGLR